MTKSTARFTARKTARTARNGHGGNRAEDRAYPYGDTRAPRGTSAARGNARGPGSGC